MRKTAKEIFNWPDNRPLEKMESEQIKRGMNLILEGAHLCTQDREFECAMTLFEQGLRILYKKMNLMEERGRGV